MGGREQKDLTSILEERIVRLALIHQPVSVILPHFENSRNVEMFVWPGADKRGKGPCLSLVIVGQLSRFDNSQNVKMAFPCLLC